ncbi:MAG: hypothetical protein IT385_24780 [Deltaproteobacteria bacterium]|nr:hypothetical protein [Deltaproteobacteria bacterium]
MLRAAWAGGIFLTMGLGTAGCPGDLDFHSNRGYDDMVCDSAGCWMCQSGDCIEYRCDETHQCPMERTCSIDQRCLPGGTSNDPGTGACDSHDDCAVGQICTLEGTCVKSPGGGPDASVDTGGGDTGGEVTLPDHPDDACRTNLDCGTDGTCINGGCYFACAADQSCPPGQGCDAGQCKPLSSPENECTFNGECGTSHACVEGTCYATCEETLDCPAHTRCASNLCVADTTPVIQCSGPSSCGEGLACIDGKCLAACGDGCADGFECKFDRCSPIATCFDQADCGGADCVNGACSD